MSAKEFEHFYKENIDRIYRYVFFRVGKNQETAEDLVSEIFMKALNSFDKYDPKISKSAWIYRIAHNHLANYYRDKKQEIDLADVAPFLVGEKGQETLDNYDINRQLENALAQLSKEDQKLVTMKHLGGYSYKEMSELLEKSADALKMATNRAMKKLKKLCSG